MEYPVVVLVTSLVRDRGVFHRGRETLVAEPIGNVEEIEALIRGMDAPTMPKRMRMAPVRGKLRGPRVAAEQMVDH